MRPGLPHGGPGFFHAHCFPWPQVSEVAVGFLKWPQVFNLRCLVCFMCRLKTCTHFGQVAVGF